MEKKKPTPPRELVDLLATYHFPGNVRELEAMVFDAVANHRAKILSMDTFQKHIDRYKTATPAAPHNVRNASSLFSELDQLPTLKMATETLIEEAMRRANGNQTLAARLLGLTQSALNKRLTRTDKSPDE
jgi:transcriptional regulator with GAF, ATPase, and Fis domain